MRIVVEFADLRPGDKIVATGPWSLDPPTEVDGFPEGNRVELVNPDNTEGRRYAYRNAAGLPFTVERASKQAPILADTEPEVLAALTEFAPRVHRSVDHWTEHGEPVAGSVVMFRGRGYWQPGVVTYVGRTRARIAYVTKSGIRKRNEGYWWTVLHPYIPLDAIYVVGGEPWVALALRTLKGN